MAQALQAETALPSQVLFELDSFELAAGERLEVSGRWFGVRGRRFVRPTLTLVGEHQRLRSLADLEHKPWSATDGESWVASFPLDPGARAVKEVELAVAPDIAVSLPAPPPLRERDEDAPGEVDSNDDGREMARLRAQLDGARREAVRLGEKLESARRDVTRLRQELEKSGATKAELTSALSRRDAAISKFEAVITERDEAVHERDEAKRERDGALHEREAMVRTLKRTRAQLEQSVSARNAAHKRIDEQRESTSGELEEMRKAWTAQVAQLRRTIEEERAAHERAAHERTAHERTAHERTVQAERVVRVRPAFEPVAAPAPPLPPPSKPASASALPSIPRSSRWLTRLVAMLVLLIAVTAVIIIVHSP